MKEIVHHCCSCIYKDGKKHIRLTDDDSFFHMFQFFFTNNGKKNLAVLDWWFVVTQYLSVLYPRRGTYFVVLIRLAKNCYIKKQTPAVNFKPYRGQNERKDAVFLLSTVILYYLRIAFLARLISLGN